MIQKQEYKIVQFSDYPLYIQVNRERSIVFVEDGHKVKDVDQKMRKIKDRSVFPKEYPDHQDKLGLEGWELFFCHGLSEFTDQILIFQRPLKEKFDI